MVKYKTSILRADIEVSMVHNIHGKGDYIILKFVKHTKRPFSLRCVTHFYINVVRKEETVIKFTCFCDKNRFILIVTKITD